MNTYHPLYSHQHPRVASDKVGPDDLRYADLVRRGFNKRFAGKPDYVRLVGGTSQVVDAVQEAVRSGGHCLEGFVADPAVRVVIDTSLMTSISYDSDMNAFAVEAGATLSEVYRKLFLGWGVTIPAGISPSIGVGGHVLGGAFGYLCRQHGLAADHLDAVEVVVEATASAQRESILTMTCSTARQDPQDEARSLVWVRQFYRDLFADTGGVPVPSGVGNGALINHPDVDLADPEWNTSGVPWHTLYYKDNYPRLQQIKARWDPRNVFHHDLSIRPT